MSRRKKLIATLSLIPILSAQSVLKFQGQAVIITEPKEGGPASICVEWTEQRQCYTTPQGYSRAPEGQLVQITKDLDALLFSAKTEGATDYGIHFALLVRGAGRELQDLFFATIEASNQSRYALWTEPSIRVANICPRRLRMGPR